MFPDIQSRTFSLHIIRILYISNSSSTHLFTFLVADEVFTSNIIWKQV